MFMDVVQVVVNEITNIPIFVLFVPETLIEIKRFLLKKNFNRKNHTVFFLYIYCGQLLMRCLKQYTYQYLY